MDNLLSIITFLPAVAALVMALFLRGDDAAAQKNAKKPRGAILIDSGHPEPGP